LGQNNRTEYSSPKQVGSDTTWTGKLLLARNSAYCAKTDGTLWAWGENESGQLGQNQSTSGGTDRYSSPVQIGSGTNWYTEHNTSTNGNKFVILSERA